MTRTRLLRLLAPAALLLAAVPARAQVGNQTDIPVGPIGAAAGGSYLGPGLRVQNEMFARDGNDGVVFRNARTGCAVRTAERVFRDSVAIAPRTGAQTRVQTLLGILPGAPDPEGMAATLAHGADPASPFGRAARALADALNGLMRDRAGCPEDRDAYQEAAQWEAAITAFNHYVRIAPDAAFSPPPPELVAIHAALQSVVYHALTRKP
ncbi:MAG TPA: hypothetical protein VEX86_23765 [Longimicrobium sp.]|nr:hypothetical protein [Longimicrobium sp.]